MVALPEIVAGPNLIQSLNTFRSVMVNASGVFFWIPLGIYVSLEHSKGNFNTLTRILLPLIIFYFLIFFIKSSTMRVILNLIIFFFVYACLILFGIEIQTVSIPLGVIFIAGIILIAFGLNFKYALTLLPILLLMEYLVANTAGSNLILSGASFNLELFMLYHAFIAFIGISFNYSLEATLKFVDKETSDFAMENQAHEAFLIQQSMLRNLKNKIHGLLLTHLSLIGQSRMKILDKDLMLQIKKDLSSSNEIESKLSETSLLEIVKKISSNNSSDALNFSVKSMPDFQIPLNLASDIQEVLSEVFRNISKHAYAKNVSLTCNLFRNNLTFLIEDDGIGPGEIKANRFGVKSTIFETLVSMKGSIKYLARKPQGTITEIVVPIKKEVSLKYLTPEFISDLIYSKVTRFLIIFLQFILFSYFLTEQIVLSNPIIFLLHLCVFASLFLSLFSKAPLLKNVTSILFFIFSLIFIFALSNIFDKTSQAGAWNWILNTLNLAFIFYFGFQKIPLLRWSFALIYVGFIFFIILQMPSEVSSIMWPPFLTGVTSGIAFVAAILLFNKKIVEKINIYESLYQRENIKQANLDFARITNSLWQTQPSVGVEIINRAFANPEVLNDPNFIREAQIEQARLRSLLNIDPSIASELNFQILTIIKLASENNNIFELEFHGSQYNNPPVPNEYFEFVKSLVKIP